MSSTKARWRISFACDPPTRPSGALTPEAKDLAAEINTRVVAQVALNECKLRGVKTNRAESRDGAFLADLLIARWGWNRFAMRLGYNDGDGSGWDRLARTD